MAYLQTVNRSDSAPKREESSHTARIMRVPLSGGSPQFVLEGPLIWNQQCARLPSTLCIYTPSEPNQQRFVGFDPMTGASAEISAAKIGDNTEEVVLVPGWGEIGGVDWAADGKSLWVGAARNVATSRPSDAWALLRIFLDGTIETVSENGPVKFRAAVPSPAGTA